MKKIYEFFYVIFITYGFIEKCDLTYVHALIKSSTSIQGMAPTFGKRLILLIVFQLVPNHIGVIVASPINKIRRLPNVGAIPCIEVELFIKHYLRNEPP
jgi:uncharacterized membrane protein